MSQKYKKFQNLFLALNEDLKKLALTHSSFANDHNIESNERLEYLGDSVLGLIVAEFLYKNCKGNEGKLSKMRSTLVCENNLAKIAKEFDIEKQMLFGKSLQNIKISDSILGDVIEALIGAMFLQFGFSSIKTAVYSMLDIKDFVDHGGKTEDYKTLLQEYCQKNKKSIVYLIEQKKNNNGQNDFVCKCYLDEKYLGKGKGSNKRIAEQNVAQLIFNRLTK